MMRDLIKKLYDELIIENKKRGKFELFNLI